MSIPNEKFEYWFSCFSNNNGRFLSNPCYLHEKVIVSFCFEKSNDYSSYSESYSRAFLKVRETNISFIKKYKRKFYSFFKNKG